MRSTTLLSSLGFIVFLIGVSFVHHKTPQWKAVATSVFDKIESSDQLGLDEWKSVVKDIEKLPSVFPMTLLQNSVEEVNGIFLAVKDIERVVGECFEREPLKTDQIFTIFSQLQKIEQSLGAIQDNVESIPSFLLSEEEQLKKAWLLSKLVFAQEKLRDVKTLERIVLNLAATEGRIVFLLQNQNEPRPTGGFVGALLVVDLSREKIVWKFEDVYALSRRVEETDKLPAPDFFSNLAQTISLHDANFWADFPTSAEQYIHFFNSIGEPPPDVLVAVNLNVVREIIKMIGHIELEKWGITLDEFNFDIGLSFLVESKINGRFDVKKPVEDFMRTLFASKHFKTLSYGQLEALNISDLVSKKNIFAYAVSKPLQELFDRWGIAGRLRFKRHADNFLFFDFVSVGANKSEKFMWTKFWHDSKIQKNGVVKNSLEIVRTHALKPGEIEKSLDIEKMPINTKKLLTEEVLWKLGEGQNRTVLRVAVPKDAKLITQNNPSGHISESFVPENQYKFFEVPMFVLPGERVKIHLEYETFLERGSHNWRPYFLDVVGAYGKNQVTFLETISTEKEGLFTAKTDNIGVPQNLVDAEFRTVVEFGE